MMTEVMRIDPGNVAAADIHRLALALERGDLMVFPTDTFYGLGADGFSRHAIRRVYALKARDVSKPLLVLISDVDMVERLARDVPPVFWKIANEFWPGPLTMVLRASEAVPRELCGGGDSVAMRLPAVSWLQALVRETGCPVIATSANVSGEGEILSAEQALQVFSGKVELVVDGGPTPGGAPSTVLDLTVEPPRIIREGAVATDKLKKYL